MMKFVEETEDGRLVIEEDGVIITYRFVPRHIISKIVIALEEKDVHLAKSLLIRFSSHKRLIQSTKGEQG